MIDFSKLRYIAKKDPVLSNIVESEPLSMSKKEFKDKFPLLWYLPKKEAN